MKIQATLALLLLLLVVCHNKMSANPPVVTARFPEHLLQDVHPNAIYWIEFDQAIYIDSGTVSFRLFTSGAVFEDLSADDTDCLWVEGNRLYINLRQVLPSVQWLWVMIPPGLIKSYTSHQAFSGWVNSNGWRFRTRGELLTYSKLEPSAATICFDPKGMLTIELSTSDFFTSDGQLHIYEAVSRHKVLDIQAGLGVVEGRRVHYDMQGKLMPETTYFVLVDTSAFSNSGALSFIGVKHANIWFFSTGVPPPRVMDCMACEGERCLLRALPPLGFEESDGFFLWYDSPTAPQPLIDEQGNLLHSDTLWLDTQAHNQTFFVSWQKGACQSKRVPIRARRLPSPNVRILIPPPPFYVGDTVRLSATGATFYHWSPAQHIIGDTMGAQVYVRLVDSLHIRLVGYNMHGCTSWVDTLLRAQQRTYRAEAFLPTLFSPNQDGQNDYFRLLGYGIARVHLRIYNKQGTLLFEAYDLATAMQQGWDGNYRGIPQPSDMYIWEIEGNFVDGSPLHVQGKQRGWVMLLR